MDSIKGTLCTGIVRDFSDIVRGAKNVLLDTLRGSLWNSTRTGHILPMLDSFATSIARQHKGLFGQVNAFLYLSKTIEQITPKTGEWKQKARKQGE